MNVVLIAVISDIQRHNEKFIADSTIETKIMRVTLLGRV